jgi:hypothetical protein
MQEEFNLEDDKLETQKKNPKKIIIIKNKIFK